MMDGVRRTDADVCNLSLERYSVPSGNNLQFPAYLCIYSFVCVIFPLNIVPIPSYYTREVCGEVRQIFDGDLYEGTVQISPTYDLDAP